MTERTIVIGMDTCPECQCPVLTETSDLTGFRARCGREVLCSIAAGCPSAPAELLPDVL
jgi:hypothetical protein